MKRVAQKGPQIRLACIRALGEGHAMAESIFSPRSDRPAIGLS